MNNVGQFTELHHEVPQPLPLRVMLVTVGVFTMSVPVWELWRGIWPLNLTTSFFALILAGAWTVGGALIFAGLFGQAVSWCVTPGLIEINTRTLFRTQGFRYRPADIEDFAIMQIERDSGPDTWSVVMTARDGRRHETRSFENRTDAERLKDEIAALSRHELQDF